MNAKMAVFELPGELNATMPPERRGIRRDHVKLLVLDRQSGHVSHTRFDRLEQYIRDGDLLVLNTSRTIPAVLHGAWKRNGAVLDDSLEIRLARRVNDNTWDALAVTSGVKPGDSFEFTSALSATVTEISSKPLSGLSFRYRALY